MNIAQSSRFKDAPWYPGGEAQHCIIGGAGGIGSWLSLMLARAGFNPIVYDFDIIEEHNIGGQLFSNKDVGTHKVAALSRIVKEFADTDIMANNERYTPATMTHTYVFSAFDNMQARKDMFANWKVLANEWLAAQKVVTVPDKVLYSLVLTDGGPSKSTLTKELKAICGGTLKAAREQLDSIPSVLLTSEDIDPLDLAKLALEEIGASVEIVGVDASPTVKDTVCPIFIDGRLLMEQLTIFCVTPDKIAEYEKHLFDDSEVAEAPCTLKQTSHTAAMIASHMVAFFTNHFANNMVGEKDRTIPFRWEYFIPINYLNEE